MNLLRKHSQSKSNFALIPGYLNPALKNRALVSLGLFCNEISVHAENFRFGSSHNLRNFAGTKTIDAPKFRRNLFKRSSLLFLLRSTVVVKIGSSEIYRAYP